MDADMLTPSDETFAESARRERCEALARLLAPHPTGVDLRFARKAMGMRQADLAARLDVAPETVTRWETGAIPVQRVTLLAVTALVILGDVTLTKDAEGQAQNDAVASNSSHGA